MAHPTVPSHDKLSQYYDTSKEKHAILFNHDDFPKTAYYNYELPQTRTGTHEDVEAIKTDLGKLGFKITVYHNKDYDTILKILTEMRNTDYSHLSCLCVIFLTHGFENDFICASDRAYNFNDVTKMFENHPTLDGKPKLFFVQACRGHKMDSGTSIAYDSKDGNQRTMVIPSNADFLVVRSTTEGSRSYKGSGMIQDLCSATSQGHGYLDLLEIITANNKRLASVYPNTTRDEETHEINHVPETTFNLTKFLQFRLQPGSSAKKLIKYKPDKAFYDMTGEKLIVLFNHKDFQSTAYYNFQPPEPRTNTQQDVEAIKKVFGELDFNIIVYDDMDYNMIIKTLTDMRNADYSHLSCLCVFILTSGCQNDGICASDRVYNLNEVTKNFENHRTLDGKPKLFFIQADKMDAGSSTAYNGDGGNKTTMTSPLKPDFLVMRSTREDHLSYRDERGSWMIQNLCAVVSEGHELLDLLQIITITNKRVALLHSTNTGNTPTHGKKQMPETKFTLTKLLKFKSVDKHLEQDPE